MSICLVSIKPAKGKNNNKGRSYGVEMMFSVFNQEGNYYEKDKNIIRLIHILMT